METTGGLRLDSLCVVVFGDGTIPEILLHCLHTLFHSTTSKDLSDFLRSSSTNRKSVV